MKENSRNKLGTKHIRYRQLELIVLASIYAKLLLLIVVVRKAMRTVVAQQLVLVLRAVRIGKAVHEGSECISVGGAEAVVELVAGDRTLADGFDIGKTGLAGGAADVAEDSVCGERDGWEEEGYSEGGLHPG